eukprot:m.26353 g.26353  ORF g.26353 m.26353 type:complete len:395 (+) comp11500_c0_seq1:347-1531(+)
MCANVVVRSPRIQVWICPTETRLLLPLSSGATGGAGGGGGGMGSNGRIAATSGAQASALSRARSHSSFSPEDEALSSSADGRGYRRESERDAPNWMKDSGDRLKDPAEKMKDLGFGPAASSARHARHPRRWQRGKLLGSGAFGQVFLALDMDTGAELAVKQVELHPNNDDVNLREVQALEAEIALLKNMRHERIVTYYGTDRTAEYLTIFMEYVPGRSVHNRLLEYGAFSEDIARKYTRQLLEGLHYLHENKIVHRDLKGANVLADANGNVKLADFGSSKRLRNIKTYTGFKSVHGTPYWMAPEVINGRGYGRKSDIWSLACTVVEMLTTVPPFMDCEPMAALFRIGQESTDTRDFIPQGLSPQADDFLCRCFQRSPAVRPTAAEIMEHEFVSP